MTITLDTPEQITMWVLLSRRAQLKLQAKGITTKGLIKWCRENIPGAEKARTWKDCVVPVEYAISQAGGDVDYSLVNIQMLEIVRPNEVFQDMGIYDGPGDIAPDSYIGRQYINGRMEVVLTLEEPRPATGDLMSPA